MALVGDSWTAGLPLALLFGSPWLAAIAWILVRTRGRPGDGEAFPSLADRWRRRL